MELKEAIKTVQTNAKEKFDSTIEVHINLGLDSKKQDQNVRFSITLPNGTGKSKKVAVLTSKKIADADLNLTEVDIDKLANGGIRPKVDFEVLITEPSYMPKLAKAAKILGPAGVMPNPKNGTVTDNIEKAVKDVKKGKIDIKTEKDIPVIHTLIGKKSFTTEQLAENFEALLSTLRQNKPNKASPEWIKSVFLSSTMGKSVLVDTEQL